MDSNDKIFTYYYYIFPVNNTSLILTVYKDKLRHPV